MLCVVLADGREVSAPLAWLPRLRDASPAERQHWRLIDRGGGIHWPNIDEDVSVVSPLRLLRGPVGAGATRRQAGAPYEARPVVVATASTTGTVRA